MDRETLVSSVEALDMTQEDINDIKNDSYKLLLELQDLLFKLDAYLAQGNIDPRVKETKEMVIVVAAFIRASLEIIDESIDKEYGKQRAKRKMLKIIALLNTKTNKEVSDLYYVE